MTRLITILMVLLCACEEQATAPLLVRDIVITESIPGKNMSAGFMTLRNNTNETIEIDAVTSAEFANVNIHESTIENGIARMRPLESLTIAAKSSVTLQNGGIHLMLMGSENGHKTGDKVTLSFYSGESLLLTVATQTSQGGR